MRTTHLADASALALLSRNDVAARLVPLIVGGGAATCGIVDLEVLGAFDQSDRHDGEDRTGMFCRACPSTTPCWTGRSRCKPRSSGPMRVIALIVAATAERAGLVLLHDDDAYDEIAEVTGQPTERAIL